MPKPLSTDIIEIEKYYSWVGPDGIARTQVKEQAEIQIEHARANTKLIETFFNGDRFPLLVDARKVKSISKEAREHFSIKDRDTVVSAYAILIASPLSRMIGNFFMGINKPEVPVRLFTNENEAIQWLKKFD